LVSGWLVPVEPLAKSQQQAHHDNQTHPYGNGITTGSTSTLTKSLGLQVMALLVHNSRLQHTHIRSLYTFLVHTSYYKTSGSCCCCCFRHKHPSLIPNIYILWKAILLQAPWPLVDLISMRQWREGKLC